MVKVKRTTTILRSCHDEKGDILLLAAALLYGLIFFAVVLTIDTNTGFSSNKIAQVLADGATGVQNVYLMTAGIAAAEAAAGTLPADGIAFQGDKRHLVKAVRFFVPVFTDVIQEDDPTAQNAAEIYNYSLYGGGDVIDFGDWGLPCPSTVDTSLNWPDGGCKIVRNLNSTEAQEFAPTGFWSLREHGQHFGAQVRTEATSMFLTINGQRRVEGFGKSVVSIRHRRERALTNNGVPLPGLIPNPVTAGLMPGLGGESYYNYPSFIIAYAGQGATGDETTRSFGPSAFSYTPSTIPESSTIDPWNLPYGGFTGNSLTGGVFNLSQMYPQSENLFALTGVGNQAAGTTDLMNILSSLAPYATGFSQTRLVIDMAMSCHSPWKQVANQIMGYTVDVLAKLGNFRDTMQFVYVNSRNDPASPLPRNPPTVIKAPERDPFPNPGGGVEDSITAPFVNFVDSSLNYKCGYSGTTGCSLSEMFYLEQLRSCVHTYSVDPFGNLFPQTLFEYDGINSELPSYTLTDQATHGFNHSQSPAAVSWGQYGGDKPILSLTQVVNSIGVEQSCPIRSPRPSPLPTGLGFGYVESTYCYKPNDGTGSGGSTAVAPPNPAFPNPPLPEPAPAPVVRPADLTDPSRNVKPDLLALFQYANDIVPSGWERPGPMVLTGPPISATTLRNSFDRSPFRNSGAGVFHPSDLVLFMHQRPDYPADGAYAASGGGRFAAGSYHQQVQAAVNSFMNNPAVPKRRVIVVFFMRGNSDEASGQACDTSISPGRPVNFTETVLQDLFCMPGSPAFNGAGAPCSVVGENENILFIIKPDNERIGLPAAYGATSCSPVTSSSICLGPGVFIPPASYSNDSCYREFYEDLLRPGGRFGSAEDFAKQLLEFQMLKIVRTL